MSERVKTYGSSRILLVDDERLVVTALAHMLRAVGYRTDLAYNGQEALEKVSARDYDLIICDIRMPVMDGQAFYGQLRSVRPQLSERVIFCTGDWDAPSTRGFLEASGAPVITKPFCMRHVLDLVLTRVPAKSFVVQAAV